DNLGGLLLVGNFGDGRINAFNPTSGAFVTSVDLPNGNPIVIDGLWAIHFGNGAHGFSTNKLYFAAGINDEADGLFGSVQPTPEPGTIFLLAAGLISVAYLRSKS